MKKIFALVLALVVALSVGFTAFAEENESYSTSVLMRTTGSVNVREWAWIEGPVVSILEKGACVEVYGFYPHEDGRVWCKVQTYDGYEYGWAFVSMKYLEPVDTSDFNYEFEFGTHAQVTGETVNVREYESLEAEVVIRVHMGDVVEVVEYIPTSDGRMWAGCRDIETGEYIGWISMRYLAIVELEEE